MHLHEISGSQLYAARKALGLTPAGLADQSGVNVITIRLYESCGDKIPRAHLHVFVRLVRTLEDQGVVFEDGGIRLQRPMSTSTVPQEGAVA
jgi:hypothetical protein